MLKTTLPAIIISLVLIASSLNAEETRMDLSQFQWKNRLMFLIAPNRSHYLVAQSLRDKFDVGPGRFVFILVGKDVSVKLDRQEQTRLEDIIESIKPERVDWIHH